VLVVLSAYGVAFLTRILQSVLILNSAAQLINLRLSDQNELCSHQSAFAAQIKLKTKTTMTFTLVTLLSFLRQRCV